MAFCNGPDEEMDSHSGFCYNRLTGEHYNYYGESYYEGNDPSAPDVTFTEDLLNQAIADQYGEAESGSKLSSVFIATGYASLHVEVYALLIPEPVVSKVYSVVSLALGGVTLGITLLSCDL